MRIVLREIIHTRLAGVNRAIPLEVPHFLRMVVLVHADTISNSDFYGSRYRYAEYDGSLQA